MAFARRKKARQRWARSGLAAFVLVWLNMALQPCVMALETADDHDCPHCPPTVATQHCEPDVARCAFVGDYEYDGRSAQLKLKDPAPDQPLALAPLALTDSPLRSAVRQSASAPARASPGAPPLHELYCVYLN